MDWKELKISKLCPYHIKYVKPMTVFAHTILVSSDISNYMWIDWKIICELKTWKIMSLTMWTLKEKVLCKYFMHIICNSDWYTKMIN